MAEYFGEILAIVFWCFSLAATVGYFKNKIEVMEERMKAMDSLGSQYAREAIVQIKQTVTFHEQRLQTSEAHNNRLQELMGSMNSKLAVIADWVEQQRKKS